MWPCEKIISACQTTYQKPNNNLYKYGTAGFRDKAKGMDFIMFRMGILATLRSKCTKSNVGVMITASHNPIQDNGVKIIDPDGEMLTAEWEKYATEFVNATNDQLEVLLNIIVTKCDICSDYRPVVDIGHDNRPSSKPFFEALEEGIRITKSLANKHFEVTTPVVHFCVAKNNESKLKNHTIEDYMRFLCEPFEDILSQKPETQNYVPELYIDCANGVGQITGKIIAENKNIASLLKMNLINTGGEINYLCGSDFVKTQNTPPANAPKTANAKIVSFDGDADRIVYCFVDENAQFHLLDGDKIAALIGQHVQTLLKKAGLEKELKMVVIQTAYANGASTNFISETLGVEVACTLTGVKHLHAVAKKYDIGIYFEANGHGTVLCSKKTIQLLKEREDQGACKASAELYNLLKIANPYVGDALSDMLLVEAILMLCDWSISDWDNIYTDFPNRLVKVHVEDRSIIETTNAERTCLKPEKLQKTIDEICSKYPQSRAFVRPSGTEDVVRVYAESNTEENVSKLCFEVSTAVYEQANGTGPRPQL